MTRVPPSREVRLQAARDHMAECGCPVCRVGAIYLEVVRDPGHSSDDVLRLAQVFGRLAQALTMDALEREA